uniref:Scorpine-like peptide Ev37 n=2 Tax=Iurida TaxID=259439 RepID=KBX3_EUSVA|nr:RecName: Full=Scorpine-like peptide Ev37; Flags: Precursor [Euscorpiops validus]AOF40189.1 venom peptide HtLKTx7 [Hadogenes troglodytes]
MNSKLTVIVLLALITIASCGLINEKKVQQYLDEKLPNGVVKGALKSLVHKAAKNQNLCAFNVDTVGMCDADCKRQGKAKGVCHGTKCKCDVELSYKK